MYTSLANQAYHIFHFALSFATLFIIVPLAMFVPVKGNWSDRLAANFMRMLVFIICAGYLLVVTKLYEVIGMTICVVSWILVQRGRRNSQVNPVPSFLVTFFYDVIEGRYLIETIKERLRTARDRTQEKVGALKWDWRPELIIRLAVIVGLAIALFIRGYDAVMHPAPAMSDGYVTLAWTKYVDERYLFHDGIYPQGFYFYLSMLGKISFTNLLYTLKYAGPLDALLIVVGMYYAVVRWSNDRLAGLVVVVLYGILGHLLLGGDWDRQAATNSQEFAFIFVAPTLYFVSRYLASGSRSDMWTALAGLGLIGLSHPMPYIEVCVGTVAFAMGSLIFHYDERLRRVLGMGLIGVISAAVAVVPLGMGKLLGGQVNSSSQSFITSQAKHAVPLPPLHVWDIAALVSILILLILVLIHGVRGEKPVVWLSVAILGVLIFSLNEFGGPITKSTVLLARTLDLWAMTEVVVIAMGIAALHRFFYGAVKMTTAAVLWAEAALVIFGTTAYAAERPIQPIVPYKMQWNEGVAQYLNIDSKYRYSGYMIVAPTEFYALVLGNGYNLDTGEFVKSYNPAKPALTKSGQSTPDYGLAPNVFIYQYKQIYEVDKTNSIYPLEVPIYQQERTNQQALAQWINVYKSHHKNLQVFYNGPHMVIYLIHPKPKTTPGVRAKLR